MTHGFNEILCKQIETDLLNHQPLVTSCMNNREGSFKIFVRNGELQKVWSVPTKTLSHINEDDTISGIRYSVYKDIIKSIVEVLAAQDQQMDYGYILVDYKGDREGESLEKFNVTFQDESHFHRGNNKNKR